MGYAKYFGAHKIISILRTKTHISNCLWDLIQINFHLATAIPSISTKQLLEKTTIFYKELHRYSQIGVSCPKAVLENLSRGFLFISKGLPPTDTLQIGEDNTPLKYSHYHKKHYRKVISSWKRQLVKPKHNSLARHPYSSMSLQKSKSPVDLPLTWPAGRAPC